MKNLAFHSLLRLKDEYTTNSHYCTYAFLFKRLGEMYFLNLGVKGLTQRSILVSGYMPTYSSPRANPNPNLTHGEVGTRPVLIGPYHMRTLGEG